MRESQDIPEHMNIAEYSKKIVVENSKKFGNRKKTDENAETTEYSKRCGNHRKNAEIAKHHKKCRNCEEIRKSVKNGERCGLPLTEVYKLLGSWDSTKSSLPWAIFCNA